MPPSDVTATSVVPPPMSTIMLPTRLGHGQAGADGRGHRFFDQVGLTRAGADGGVVDGALLHLGHAAGDADDHPGPRHAQEHALVHLVDEVVEHLLRDVEVRDDAIAQRRMATMLPGVRPTISLASEPMASTLLVFLSIATTDGSLITMPRLRT